MKRGYPMNSRKAQEREVERLRRAIKIQMKKNKLRYSELADLMDLSVPTVKRMLTSGQLTMDRVMQICDAVGVTFYELVEMAKKDLDDTLTWMTHEQESFLVKHPDASEYLIQIMNGAQPDQLIKYFGISPAQSMRYIRQLEDKHFITCSSTGKFRVTKEVLRGPKPGGVLDQQFIQKCAHAVPSLVKRSLETQENFHVVGFNLSLQSQAELRIQLKDLLSQFATIEKYESRTLGSDKLKPITIINCLSDVSIYAEAYRGSIKKIK